MVGLVTMLVSTLGATGMGSILKIAGGLVQSFNEAREKKAEREDLIDQIVEYNINNGTEVIFLEPRDMYDHAIHGYSREGRVIYSNNEIIQSHVVDDGMTHEEAIEWVEFNTFGTFDYMSSADWIKDNPNINPPLFKYEE